MQDAQDEAEEVREGAPQTEQRPRRPSGSGLGPGPGRVQTVPNGFWLRDEQLGGVAEAAPCRQ